MEFKRRCPACQTDMAIDETLLQSPVVCPTCSTTVDAPGTGEPERFNHIPDESYKQPFSIARSVGLMAGHFGFVSNPHSPVASIRANTSYLWLRCWITVVGALAVIQTLAVFFQSMQIYFLARAAACWIGWRLAVVFVDAADSLISIAKKRE